MILIVDDDKAIRQSLALVLKRKGYETALAGNPDEALGMLRKHKFRLVIMDMNYSLSTTGEEEYIFCARQKYSSLTHL